MTNQSQEKGILEIINQRYITILISLSESISYFRSDYSNHYFFYMWVKTEWMNECVAGKPLYICGTFMHVFLEKEKKRIFLMNQIMTVFEWKLIKFK